MLKSCQNWLGRLRLALRVLLARRRVGVHHWLVENPYHQMMYCQFADALQPARLSNLDELAAFTRLPAKGRLLWVHFEGSYSWGERGAALERRFLRYQRAIMRWVSKGGAIAWAVHDIDLHLNDRNAEHIDALRALLCEHAQIIHVHSQAAKVQVARVLGLDSERVHVVPHPSYATHYPNPPSRGADDRAPRRSLLFFGHLKPYKNVESLASALTALTPSGFARLTVAGQKHYELDLDTEALRAVTDLDIRPRYIDDDEVPQLFADTHFLALPYSDSMTSGAAALAMGFGVPIIAADLGGMRESVPAENHKLLYDPSDSEGLSRALKTARDMSVEEYRSLRTACLTFADNIHPRRVSEELLRLLCKTHRAASASERAGRRT